MVVVVVVVVVIVLVVVVIIIVVVVVIVVVIVVLVPVPVASKVLICWTQRSTMGRRYLSVAPLLPMSVSEGQSILVAALILGSGPKTWAILAD